MNKQLIKVNKQKFEMQIKLSPDSFSYCYLTNFCQFCKHVFAVATIWVSSLPIFSFFSLHLNPFLQHIISFVPDTIDFLIIVLNCWWLQVDITVDGVGREVRANVRAWRG